MTAEKARAALAGLEARLGFRLDDVPVGDRDQWTATVRDGLAELGVDLNDPKQAAAAFAGAHGVLGIILPVAILPQAAAVTAASYMRLLADRADGVQS